ncbi:uncharacterized protein LOC125236754 [Leguminivora glycinivorella]|uniref:uncharacterized protein LOC125236754 n=1 Tax=Leguminivora glycinivorella TaxID=1035111 RepID=UPI00200FBEEF|nr:uncharacterized protein LOC125236754 [Leguminivora glycinivorella]
MGKRRRRRSDDIRRKIKRLKRSLDRRHQYSEDEVSEYDSAEETYPSDYEAVSEASASDYSNTEELKSVIVPVETPDPNSAPALSTESPPTSGSAAGPSTSIPEAPPVTLPDNILEALGGTKEKEEKFGPNVPDEIAKRWGRITVEGLGKEEKEELTEKFLVPENFKLLKAPKLNAEIATVMSESSRQRDKRMEKSQNQLGLAIAGLSKLTGSLISENLDKLAIIKHIADILYLQSPSYVEEIYPAPGKLEGPTQATGFASKQAGWVPRPRPDSCSSASSADDLGQVPTIIVQERQPAATQTSLEDLPPTLEETYPGGDAIIRKAFSKQALTPQTIDIMISSLSTNSLKQYNCVLYKWWLYCKENKFDCFSVNTSVVLNFLTEQYQQGSSYSSLNTSRSALSLILGESIGKDKHVSRFLKGVYKIRPCFPKYQTTWDPNIVLNHLSTLYPNEIISLDLLTRKTVTLLALSTAQRVQTLSLIKIYNVQINEDNIKLIIDDLIKTSAPGRPMPRLIIPFFPDKIEICPARTLMAYIDITQIPRNTANTERLFLTIKKPFHNASSSTISRWIKQTLSDSGVNTDLFCAHSTRHAATSAAKRKGLSIEIIKKTAGWSGNSLVFSKFYNRPLTADTSVDNAFAEAVYNI